jgi:hypothetical protein
MCQPVFTISIKKSTIGRPHQFVVPSKEEVMKRIILLLFITAQLIACTEVGSEAWCNDMEEKPKGDWTANEAADYTKHCIF